MKKSARIILNILGGLCILLGIYFFIHTFYSKIVICSICIILFGLLIFPMVTEKIKYEFVKIKSWMIYCTAFIVLVIGILSLPKDKQIKPEDSLFYANDLEKIRIGQKATMR